MIDEFMSRLNASHHRLGLIVGGSGSGKTKALRAFSLAGDYPLINVSLELSKALLACSPAERQRQVGQLFQDLVERATAPCVLLDNIELLFEPSLQVDPLRLLKSASRNQPAVSSWLGAVENGSLVFGVHPHLNRPVYSASEVTGILVLSPAELLRCTPAAHDRKGK